MLVDKLNIVGLKEIQTHKFYIFGRLKVKKVYHTLNQTDRYLKVHATGVEFIRIAD